MSKKRNKNERAAKARQLRQNNRERQFVAIDWSAQVELQRSRMLIAQQDSHDLLTKMNRDIRNMEQQQILEGAAPTRDYEATLSYMRGERDKVAAVIAELDEATNITS